MSGAQPGPDGKILCPECGFVIRTTRDLHRRRRRWDIAGIGVTLAFVGIMAWLAPMLRAAQWHDAAPTTLLAIVLTEDLVEDGMTKPVYKELFARARQQQLSRFHIDLISSKLADAMTSRDPVNQAAAAALLSQLGQRAVHLEPELLRSAEKASPSMEWAEVFGAVGTERSVHYLIACHRETTSIVAAEYAKALARVGGEEALRELLSVFEDKAGLAQEVPDVLRLRLDRLLRLGFFGRQTDDLLAEAEILLDPTSPLWTPEEQLAASAVLRVLRGEVEHVSTALVHMVDEQSTESYAAPLLRRLGRDAAPAAPALAAAAELWSRQGRQDDAAWALRVLRNIGHRAVPALDQLSTCGDAQLESEARALLQSINQAR